MKYTESNSGAHAGRLFPSSDTSESMRQRLAQPVLLRAMPTYSIRPSSRRNSIPRIGRTSLRRQASIYCQAQDVLLISVNAIARMPSDRAVSASRSGDSVPYLRLNQEWVLRNTIDKFMT
ncbi:MAG TPA: hypothetical protein PLC76_11525 [Saprospiraceae bacterium]|nr:hypothetical protein [Saprospiraceae bacterium]HND74098.1 hypothetical protein [Saprospiraceae bacterium]HNQ41638.1 hypothetical protein [Saprospiraceae bacterium]HNU16796.1 hypothetical protein [Saprospiraceae bacterium]HQN55730.1 hypothetical protein [Saprospiraceae bacterium]